MEYLLGLFVQSLKRVQMDLRKRNARTGCYVFNSICLYVTLEDLSLCAGLAEQEDTTLSNT